MNRGVGRRAIFRTQDDNRTFLALLGEVSESFGIEVHGYCLMGNHYHLLVHTPRPGLSRAMRHLNGVYTLRFNRRSKTDGPIFRGRYRSVLVAADAHLLQVSRYIHLNPVSAGIVRKPERYAWSSHRAYAGLERKPGWLHTGEILGQIGGGAAKYRAFVEEGIGTGLETGIYQGGRFPPALGDEGFLRQVSRRLTRADRAVPVSAELAGRPSVARILKATAEAFGVSEVSLREEGRGRGNLPRGVAMALCRKVGGLPLKGVAEAFGVASYTTVSVCGTRLARRMERDPGLKRRVEALAKSFFVKS